MSPDLARYLRPEAEPRTGDDPVSRAYAHTQYFRICQRWAREPLNWYLGLIPDKDPQYARGMRYRLRPARSMTWLFFTATLHEALDVLDREAVPAAIRRQLDEHATNHGTNDAGLERAGPRSA